MLETFNITVHNVTEETNERSVTVICALAHAPVAAPTMIITQFFCAHYEPNSFCGNIIYGAATSVRGGRASKATHFDRLVVLQGRATVHHFP